MKYFGNRLEDQQRQMVRLKEMDTAEAVQILNESEYGKYMFKVEYDSIKQGQRWVKLAKKYLNKKVWSISTVFIGPRKPFAASTLKADATGVRIYITKKYQTNIDTERFRKNWAEKTTVEKLRSVNEDYEQQLEVLENKVDKLEKKLTWKNIHITNLESHIDKHLWYIEKNWFEKLIHKIKNWRNK
jgi:hypothetical protein